MYIDYVTKHKCFNGLVCDFRNEVFLKIRVLIFTLKYCYLLAELNMHDHRQKTL